MKVKIKNTNGHPIATEITDEHGNQIRCMWPITIKIDMDGIVADLRVIVDEVEIEAEATGTIQYRNRR